ncbi:protein FAM177B [Puntigrus tetrazona]|uniref:protein FAM177B n=1 Tax=Puntigrus tetrazona TaxID=1606681 RepID=UPI001C8A62CE|nr:protein FAM177B [Puntigrus tetrazona]
MRVYIDLDGSRCTGETRGTDLLDWFSVNPTLTFSSELRLQKRFFLFWPLVKTERSRGEAGSLLAVRGKNRYILKIWVKEPRKKRHGMHADEPLRDVSPRLVKVIHFSSGETLTEDESEEEEAQHQLHQAPGASDRGTWTWKDYSRFWGTQILRKSLLFCDFLGGKMAGFLGLNAAKYQYAVDQYQREHKNETGKEVLSANTVVNEEERINLSKIADKQYGAINVQDLMQQQTPEETLQYKGEQNEGYISNE